LNTAAVAARFLDRIDGSRPELDRVTAVRNPVPPDKLALLASFDFYRASPAATQAKIAASSRVAILSAGTILFREGETCRQLIAVGNGSIHTFKVAENGREITLFHVDDGHMGPVNVVSVLFDKPAIATARVDVATEAIVIPSSIARSWVEAGDPIRSALLETMATGLADAMSLVEVVAFQTIDSRLADLLLRRFARRRVISATHEGIAAELGTGREVVSRLLKGYERTGAILISRGRLELRDEAILRIGVR
jgi:CRP/FNR family transcriptional regulator